MDKDLIQIIYELLPGFMAAWLFYGLTAHPRRDIFERVVQALIFTGIIKVVAICFGWLCVRLGTTFVVGRWTKEVEFGWSMVFALAFGLTISALANCDTVHRWLREGRWIKKLGVTKKNSYPSEWFSAFQREDRWVVLHLKDKRRVRGWPEEWPNDPGTGHFLLLKPTWLRKVGDPVRLPEVHRIIIDVNLVEWVEQLTFDEERPPQPPIVATRNHVPEESNDGRPTVAT